VVDSTWLIGENEDSELRLDSVEALERKFFELENHGRQIRLMKQGSDFSRSVWAVLFEIPMGQIVTYAELARKLNSAPRAVAQACRRNPYPGIIPCHRVVSKTGIGGFMGQTSGPWVQLKQRLLRYEREVVQGR